MSEKKRVVFAGKFPACTDAKTYKMWGEAARQLTYTPRVGFCEDCTPEYQAKMKEEGRCENPWIVFRRDEDGFISGAVPLIPKFTEEISQ